MKFSKPQKVVVALLLFGAFLLGIALSEFVLGELLEVSYEHGSRVTFGLFGLVFLGGALVAHVLAQQKDS